MLPVQIQYWNYVETKRHNLVSEDQGQQSINENIRHNKKTESQTDFYNTEVKRHNLKTEAQSDFFNRETARHNRQQEAIGFQQAAASLLSSKAAMRNATANAAMVNSNIALNAARIQSTNADIEFTKAKTRSEEKRSDQIFYETLDTIAHTRQRKHEVMQGWANTTIEGTKTAFNIAGKIGGFVGGLR